MARIYVSNAPFIQKDFIVTTIFSQAHHAIDLAPYGFSGSLYAIDTFTVLYKGTHSSYGNYAIFSNGSGVMYLYAHMAGLPQKEVGETYIIHEYIAEAGSTGTFTGVHLHLEMQYGTTWDYQAPFSSYINPCTYLTDILNVVDSNNVYYFDYNPPTPETHKKSNFPWYIYQNIEEY